MGGLLSGFECVGLVFVLCLVVCLLWVCLFVLNALCGIVLFRFVFFVCLVVELFALPRLLVV